ncbi:MAG: oxidoreductase [Planctomycetota bacterium]|nr:MAG: oxidoreductase [Planctomycetota bacterium]
MNKKINIALVGLGFGAEFIPIYQKHPLVDEITICQRSEENLNKIGDQFSINKRTTDFEELLKDQRIDAIHINTPIDYHASQAIADLKAGKHVACTVPMATNIEDCRIICQLVKETGLQYMMMETVIYSREFLFIQELYNEGKFGKIQYIQASHQQDMDDWPGYWEGLPPMHYATHCVGPCLALTKDRALTVSCFGSGTIKEELIEKYNSPFAVESAQIQFKDSDLSARIMRSLFDTARQYRESIDVYGSKMSFEWPLIENDGIVLHTAKKPEPEIPEKVDCPDFAKYLPKEIQEFTTKSIFDVDENEHLSFTQGAGHGGSHPHLAHEFVSALIENRSPYPNAAESANITCVGILAHESALQNGKLLDLPGFSLE